MPTLSTATRTLRRFNIYAIDQRILPGIPYGLSVTHERFVQAVPFITILPIVPAGALNPIDVKKGELAMAIKISEDGHTALGLDGTYYVGVSFPQSIRRDAILAPHPKQLNKPMRDKVESLFKSWMGFGNDFSKFG